MKLLASFVRGLLGLSTSTAPAESGPVFIQPPPEPVKVDALLDLALVMRERWAPDASFAEPKGETEMLVEAALARVFPEFAVTSDECLCGALGPPPKDCAGGRCPTRDELQANDDKLAAFLAPIKRPDWSFTITLGGADQMASDLEEVRRRVDEVEAQGLAACSITVNPAEYLVAP